MSRSILRIDPSLSRFNPRLFYWIFIPADIICLVLQATGGALSAAGSSAEDVDTGVDISQAGLILQVVVLILFLSLFGDYLLSVKRKATMRLQKRTRLFCFFLFAAVILILVRCVFRIVELKDGYTGPEFRKEAEFIALEGG